jgi:NAD(P)-dependent dehydrogenase (short-subunit alcohol dehydrogenase family)
MALSCEFRVPVIINAAGTDCIYTHPDLQGFAKAMNGRIPLGRFGLPIDVARVALFLASPLSEYISGCSIPVDGGFLAGLPLPG